MLLHGRGADRRDLLPLGRFLPDEVVLLTPEAPHPGRPWGYGPGWAWYRYVAEDRVVPETLDESLARLGDFLTDLPDVLGFEPGPLVLGGFSQGGTTALAWALRSPDRVAGVAVLSGFLVSNVDLPLEESAPGLRVFWGHGTADPAIPHLLGERGRKRLRDAGAHLTAGDYPHGHGVTPDEMRDLAAWMGSLPG